MAEERASVTLTLTDEMSDGLRVIAQHFDELKRSMGDTQKTGDDAFKSLRDNAKQVQDAMNQVHRSAHEGAGRSKSAFDEMTKSLEATRKSLDQMRGTMGGLMQVMSSAAPGVANLAGTFSRIIPLLTGPAGIAV